MDEWTIVTVIVVLVGLFATVGKPILNLIGSITTLNNTVEGLKKEISELNTKNSASHQRLWDHNDEQDERLNNHETRIHDLEQRKA
jgi:cell division protein FtsL